MPVVLRTNGTSGPISTRSLTMQGTPESCRPLSVFTERLHRIAGLPDDVTDTLGEVVSTIRTFDANTDLVSQGDSPSQCCAILDGWVAGNKILVGGKRQITALHFAGSAPDLQSLFMPAIDYSITSLTRVEAAFIPHVRLRELLRRFPILIQAFWQEAALDAAIARGWEVNLGARRAQQRIAHLLCETGTRLEWFGHATRTGATVSFDWPITQHQLSDATGLSSVHVNRSLKALRADGLVNIKRDRATILDMPKLKSFASFNPDYLLLEQPGRKRRTDEIFG